MCLRALTISAIACLLTFAPLAPARQAPSTERILWFLRTASALVPKIENSQGCNVARNIASLTTPAVSSTFFPHNSVRSEKSAISL